MKELKEYSVGDDFFHDCEPEGGHTRDRPSAFLVKGTEKYIYLDNKFLPTPGGKEN